VLLKSLNVWNYRTIHFMVFPKVTYKTTPNKLLAQSSWYESLYMFCYHLTMGTIVTSLEKKKKKVACSCAWNESLLRVLLSFDCLYRVLCHLVEHAFSSSTWVWHPYLEDQRALGPSLQFIKMAIRSQR